jgi:hypothetical protein
MFNSVKKDYIMNWYDIKYFCYYKPIRLIKEWYWERFGLQPNMIAIVDIEGLPVKKGELVLYLGEIKNMPGHVAFAYKNKIHFGYHKEDLRLPTDDEM